MCHRLIIYFTIYTSVCWKDGDDDDRHNDDVYYIQHINTFNPIHIMPYGTYYN